MNPWACAFFALFTFFLFYEALAADPVPKSAPIAVDVAIASARPLEEMLETVGTLTSEESVVLKSELAGIVAEIPFQEGAAVKKGDLLIRLDDSVQRAEMEEAKAAVALSTVMFKRARELFDKRVNAQQTLDEAQAKLNQDKARLDHAEALLAKTRILAPFNGVIGLRQVSPGAYVTPGEPIVNLELTDSLKLDLYVPERYQSQIVQGTKISLTAEARPGETFYGSVYAINPAVDPKNRSITLRARIENPSRKLLPGAFVKANIVLSSKANAILIPQESIVTAADGLSVFAVEDGKAVKKKISTGIRSGNDIEVTQGLKEGDTVVTGGQVKLRDGMPVAPTGTPAPQP